MVAIVIFCWVSTWGGGGLHSLLLLFLEGVEAVCKLVETQLTQRGTLVVCWFETGLLFLEGVVVTEVIFCWALPLIVVY